MSLTYHILGVPLRSGSFYPGSENDARGYRDAGLLEKLRSAGCTVHDEGDVAIPSYLPHHMVPPIRSWPGPRIAWECVGDRVRPHLQQPGEVPLLLGCDCSVVVGTTQALLSTTEDVHVVYVDGDFDDAPPDPERCMSAAAMAMWLLTQGSPFSKGPHLRPSQVTVIGCSQPSQSGLDSSAVPLEEVRRLGARTAAERALAAIPSSASLLLHFDIDVFSAQEMPAAYFPHDEGLTMAEGAEIFRVLAGDARVRAIEVSEYALLRDHRLQAAARLVDMLVGGLRKED